MPPPNDALQTGDGVILPTDDESQQWLSKKTSDTARLLDE
jgi:hypothetical protein